MRRGGYRQDKGAPQTAKRRARIVLASFDNSLPSTASPTIPISDLAYLLPALAVISLYLRLYILLVAEELKTGGSVS